MDNRGLRDIDRWKEKIEVRLDNRQVFFLFFGSALVACLLFVLGVIVGKRLESRGKAVSPDIEDPLALLDKVATSSPRASQTGVTFPQELFSGSLKIDKVTRRSVATLSGSSSDIRVETNAKIAVARNSELEKEEQVKVGVLVENSEKAKVTKTNEKVAIKGAVEGAKLTPPIIPVIMAGQESKGRGHFTLQISSFQDRKEAELFARKFEVERPYLVQSEIPEKGTWFRVRLGDFANDKEAKIAKQNFEKKYNVIAYVAQR